MYRNVRGLDPILKMFKSNFESNCFSCFITPVILAGSIIGLSPFKLKCLHHRSVNSYLKPSPILRLFSLALASVLLATSSIEIYGLFMEISNVGSGSNVMLGIPLINSAIKASGGLFMLSMLYNYKLSSKGININILALEYATSIGRSNIISRNRAKTIHRKVLVMLFVYFCSSILISLLEFMVDSTGNILVGLATYVWVICYYLLHEVAKFYRILLIESYLDIKKSIRYRLGNNISLISGELLNMLVFRKIIYNSCLQYVKYLSPGLPLLIVSQIVVLTSVEYNTLIVVLDGKSLMTNLSFLITIFATILFSISGCISGYECQRLSESGDEMLSYIYQIPISKLEEDERHKISVLINVISCQKLTIRPSSVVTISFELFASIIYLSITHVMVAIQMHLDVKH